VPSTLPPPKEKKHCSKNKRPKLLNSKKLGHHNINQQFSTAFKRSTIHSAERRVFSLSHHPSRSSVVMTTSLAPCRRLLRAQRSQMRCRAGLWGKYPVSSSAVESGRRSILSLHEQFGWPDWRGKGEERRKVEEEE
jgi:hypothetical protein